MRRLIALAAVVVAALSVSLSTCGAAAQPPLTFGLVSNADSGTRAGRIAAAGASVVRVEFPIDESPDRVGRVIARFSRYGVRVLPLAGFHGRVPTIAEAQNLAGWARAFGPSGTFWRHRPGGSTLAIRDIEFGNETNQPGQFGGCGFECPAFAQRARAYALALKAAQEAIDGPQGNPAVGVLAIGDDAGSGSPNWVNDMFSAVPDLASRVAGWTAHPYGTRWYRLLDRLVSQTAARGAPPSIPIFITEIGVSTDNGRCLDDNFGWNPCMTYGEAGKTMSATIAAIRARYRGRVREIFLFQAFDQRRPAEDSDREHYFGILTSTGGSKGAYTKTMSSLLRSLR